MFGSGESNFSSNRCLRQGRVEAPTLWQKMATQLLANVDHVPLQNSCGTDAAGTDSGSRGVGFGVDEYSWLLKNRLIYQ